MISESLIMKEISRLEKNIDNMDHITKTAVLREIKKMKINLEQPEEFIIPDFLEVR